MAKKKLAPKSGSSKRPKASKTAKPLSQSLLPVPLSSLRNVVDADLSVADLSPSCTPRPYQRVAAGAIALVPRMILSDPIGSGKCHGIDTPILLSDGTVRMVQEVQVGDALLGPDGKPRIVLALGRGSGPLYRVVPIKGDPYVVNGDHILALQLTGSVRDAFWLADGRRITPDTDRIEVNVHTWLASSTTARGYMKGWRAGALVFPTAPKAIFPIPPYILGAWLGDGCAAQPAITKPHCKMTVEWATWVESLGYHIRISGQPGKCPAHYASKGYGRGPNTVKEIFRSLGLLGNKHIPSAYRTASVLDRLELLAGLLDSDGHLSTGCYDWISKYKALADDFCFVARSLGFACYVTKCTKGIKSTGFSGVYWRCSLSGDVERIPCRDKKASVRRQKKRHLVHGITVEPIGTGDYYGFQISGDGLYLLGDFTVTHNSASTILGIRKLLEMGVVSFCIGVAPGSVLYQWKTEFETWFPGVFTIEIADGAAPSRLKQYKHIKDCFGHPFKHVHILLLTYSMVRQDKKHLKDLPYQMLFFDEITHLKDQDTAQSKAAKELADAAERVLGITALPVQSKFEEIHPLLHVVEPALFGPRGRFLKNFCHTWKYWIELPNGRKFPKVEIRGYKNLELFKEMVANNLLYRTEEDIGLQLPQQIILPRWLSLTAQQEARYEEVSNGYLMLGDDLEYESIEPVEQLIRLGQICDGTQLIYPEKSSCKIDELRSLLHTELSTNQVVIFSKWTEMLDAVREEVILPMKLTHGSIVGGQSSADREAERLRFQAGDRQILLLSTAGEEGLNLGAASCMICCDSLYNEGRMRQVYGRIRRLSTPHPVVRVIPLICRDTVEERIIALREKRAALIDYLDDPAGMDPDELQDIMKLINRRVSLI